MDRGVDDTDPWIEALPFSAGLGPANGSFGFARLPRISDLESVVSRFGYDDWATVVRAVQTAQQDVESAASDLARAAEEQ